jgi:hypothetical protein
VGVSQEIVAVVGQFQTTRTSTTPEFSTTPGISRRLGEPERLTPRETPVSNEMADARALRELGDRATRWWTDLDRGWRAVAVGHLVVAAVWVAV